MTATVPPGSALAHLATLHAGLRAAVVLGARGAVLAGDAELAPRAMEVLRTIDGDGEGRRALGAGEVLAVRRGPFTVAAALASVDPPALRALALGDLRRLTHDLGA